MIQNWTRWEKKIETAKLATSLRNSKLPKSRQLRSNQRVYSWPAPVVAKTLYIRLQRLQSWLLSGASKRFDCFLGRYVGSVVNTWSQCDEYIYIYMYSCSKAVQATWNQPKPKPKPNLNQPKLDSKLTLKLELNDANQSRPQIPNQPIKTNVKLPLPLALPLNSQANRTKVTFSYLEVSSANRKFECFGHKWRLV